MRTTELLIAAAVASSLGAAAQAQKRENEPRQESSRQESRSSESRSEANRSESRSEPAHSESRSEPSRSESPPPSHDAPPSPPAASMPADAPAESVVETRTAREPAESGRERSSPRGEEGRRPSRIEPQDLTRAPGERRSQPAFDPARLSAPERADDEARHRHHDRSDGSQAGKDDGKHRDRHHRDDDHRPHHWQHWVGKWRDRHDWRRYRDENPGLFVWSYDAETGSAYQRFEIGMRLPALLFAPRYWLNDPGRYRLPPAPEGLAWVHYYRDLLLVDLSTGEILDVVHDFFR